MDDRSSSSGRQAGRAAEMDDVDFGTWEVIEALWWLKVGCLKRSNGTASSDPYNYPPKRPLISFGFKLKDCCMFSNDTARQEFIAKLLISTSN